MNNSLFNQVLEQMIYSQVQQQIIQQQIIQQQIKDSIAQSTRPGDCYNAIPNGIYGGRNSCGGARDILESLIVQELAASVMKGFMR